MHNLWEAGIVGDTDKIRQLVAEGMDINMLDDSGNTMLSALTNVLCEEEDSFRYEVVSTLLELGADPNLIPKDGCSPLFYAVLTMDTRMLQILMEAGADPNARDAGDYPESLYSWAEFDYRYELYDCLNYPEEPTVEDRKDEDAWLAYLDRMAIKNGLRRPDHLVCLRVHGALRSDELGWF